jgi:hypothetical protein
MDDLDRALAKLAAASIPAELDGVEAQVLARLGTRRAVPLTAVGASITTLVAMAIGIVGAELPATAKSAESLAPLAGSSPFAPSTLLVGEP